MAFDSTVPSGNYLGGLLRPAAGEYPYRLLDDHLLPHDRFTGHGSPRLGNALPVVPPTDVWFQDLPVPPAPPFAHDAYRGNGTADALSHAYVDGPQKYRIDSLCGNQAYPLDVFRLFPLETCNRSWHPLQPQFELLPLGTHTTTISNLDLDLSLLPDGLSAHDVYASHLDEPFFPSDHPDTDQERAQSHEASRTDTSSPYGWQPSGEASAPALLPNPWTPSETTGEGFQSAKCGSLGPPEPIWFGSPPTIRHDAIAGSGLWTKKHPDAHAADADDYQTPERRCEEAAMPHNNNISTNTAQAQEANSPQPAPLAESVPLNSTTTPTATTTHKPHHCAHCPKAFPTRSAFRRHIEKTTKPYPCPYPPCSFRGASSRDVKRHLTSKKHENSGAPSTPAERFHCSSRTCRFAEEGFARFDNYQRHMRTRHGIQVAILGGRARKEAREHDRALEKTFGSQDADEQK